MQYASAWRLRSVASYFVIMPPPISRQHVFSFMKTSRIQPASYTCSSQIDLTRLRVSIDISGNYWQAISSSSSFLLGLERQKTLLENERYPKWQNTRIKIQYSEKNLSWNWSGIIHHFTAARSRRRRRNIYSCVHNTTVRPHCAYVCYCQLRSYYSIYLSLTCVYLPACLPACLPVCRYVSSCLAIYSIILDASLIHSYGLQPLSFFLSLPPPGSSCRSGWLNRLGYRT